MLAFKGDTGGGWESPRYEPVNGMVHPRVVPPPSKPTRHTNQLDFMQKEVLKAVLKHKHSWPFQKPVDTIKLGLTDYHKVIFLVSLRLAVDRFDCLMTQLDEIVQALLELVLREFR